MGPDGDEAEEKHVILKATSKFGLQAVGIFMLIAVAGCMQATSSSSTNDKKGIQIVNREDKKRIDVYIDGALFTSYLFADATSSLKKPILYPLRTPSGIDITRGYPFEKRAGERVDHPHHAGHWLNYGDVNGIDFWNNSDAVSEDRRQRMGTIVHRLVNSTESGADTGSITVEMDWLYPDGSVVLNESTRFIFHKAEDRRIIDRITTLKAANGPVALTDNKEGMIAIRVTRALEHPDPNPVLLTDDLGQPLPEKAINNDIVTGEYLSSNGIRGTDVWGTRSPWMLLSGIIQQEPVSIAIIDHPSNPGYPTYWHARGYGLFAANPLGQKALSGGKETLDFKLEEGGSVTFRYRMAILSQSSALAVMTVKQLASDFSEEMPE